MQNSDGYQVIYDGKFESLQKVLELYSKGCKILCHKCHTELIVLPDRESASKHSKRPGIYCPVSEKHICTWFILSDCHEQFRRRFEQIQQKQLEQEQD